jgi:hypothetical protein
MAAAAGRNGGESLEKFRFRSTEAIDRAHSDDPKVRRTLRDYERPTVDNRKGDFDRGKTRSRLVSHHWRLVENGVFGSKYAVQVVHSFMCMNPMSSMPIELDRRDKWRPPVPGAKAIAKATVMEVSNVRRCMKTLWEWKLIDISEGYEHPRLLSFDEESEYQRGKDIARSRELRSGRTGRRRSVLISGATVGRQVEESEPVLRERTV